MAKFTHLHVHSHYSLLDGLPKIDELLKYVKELGMDSVALTDHGNLYGAVEFYKKAKKIGIKPIFGAEIYLAQEGMDQKRPNIDDQRYHLILLVKNEKGYKNLVKLITKAHLEGFYYKPRVDEKLLKKHSEGLICLSSCLSGRIPKLILANKIEEAEKTALRYREIFGRENFYLEIQHHPNSKDQNKANPILVSIAKKNDIPLVATNDVHYLKPEDAEAQDLLMLINTGADPNNPERLTLREDDFSLTPQEEIMKDFKELPEAIENTQKIAEACNFEFKLGKTRLPHFEVPNEMTPTEYLKELCMTGTKKRYGTFPKKEVIERLEYELSLIEKMGFVSYFLIVQDFVNWAKEHRIVVGPGRGCLLPNTKILMENGQQKNIQDVKIGDSVISREGKKRKVTNLFNYNINENIAIIESKMPTFKKIELTPDHKVLAVRHKMCPVVKDKKATICKPTCGRSCKNKLWKNYELRWIESRDLQKNDLLVYPITPKHHSKKFVFDLIKLDKSIQGNNKHVWCEFGTNKIISKKIKRFIKLDKGLARLFGYYIAEGWGRTKNRQATIGFAFHRDELENIEEVRMLLKKIFNLESTIKLHKTRRERQVFGYSKIVGLFFQNLCGEGAPKKHIPQQILECPNEIIIQLLTTLFKGDGSRKDSMRFSFDSVSLNLASQVKMLLARLGIMSSIKTRKYKQKRWNVSYKLTVSGKQLFKFNNLFKEFQVPIKQQKFYRNDTFIQRNYIHFPVKNIKFKRYQGKVYDFTVEKDVSYVANDITVHNSVAGSIVSYALGITNVDPLEYNLLFERFLNPSRISLPDIDLDFTDRRRNEVIEYITQKYGQDKVAQIITFGTMAARAAIRDVGRALGFSYTLCDKIAKLIPFGYSLTESLKKVGELRQAYETDDKVKRLIDFAKKLEGRVRHASTHACGIVISAEALDNIVPLQHPTQDDETIVTQYEMYSVEDLGLLKIDLLGLKNLTIIEDTLSRIYAVQDKKVDIESIPLDDRKTYKLLQAGDTVGVFQLESDGMRRYLKQLQPSEFEDIVAMIALYRPGPMSLIPEYIQRKNKKKKIEYLHPKLKPILKSTYGICVYQEQLMQIARELAGFSLAEADILRKAVGKKIESLLLSQQEKFIQGMVKNNIEKRVAQNLWAWILPFARYGFNRAHSCSYATIAYQTAYLKTHFPIEFMSALLTSEKGDVERIGFLIEECKKMKLEVLSPDINESFRNFSVIPKEKKIRFGLLAIKNVGDNVVEAILSARKTKGPYKSMDDFVHKIDSRTINKKSLESLIKAGVFDNFEERNKLLLNIEEILDFNRNLNRENNSAQKNLFDGTSISAPSLKLKDVEPAPLSQMLIWEKELLGLYVSSHPLEGFKEVLERKALPLRELRERVFSQKIRVGGIVSSIKKILTKKGRPMLFMKLEDLTDKVEVVVFPGIIEKNPTAFQENKIVFVTGKVDSYSGTPKLICEDIEEIIET